MIEVLLIVISLLLVAACGAFVAAEFSFITVDRPTVERAAEAGDRKAAGVLLALRSLSTQLSGAQVGITLTNLLIGFLSEPAVARLIDGPLEAAGVPSGSIKGLSIALALALATAITMVFGELVPKNLAIARPLATARAVSAFHRGFTRLFGPAIRFFNNTANAILRRVGVEPQEELASARSAEELTSLVRRSAERGTLELDTATLLERSIAFGDRHAADVMTPRVRMEAVQADSDLLATLERARRTGRSRFPVIDGDNDHVIGIIHIKDAVSVPHERRAAVPVRALMAEPVFVPSSVGLDSLLAELRRGGLQMAVVVDEFGAVDGIVTLEDLIEEIVGEVRDEHDKRDDSIRRYADGTWSLSGLLRPDEVARAVGMRLPEDEEYETLGGLVGFQLGRMPREGDSVAVDTIDDERRPHRVTLTVSAMDGLRVDRLRLISERLPHEDDEEDER
ncbi:MAG: hemolysin family protein [Solirubrobacteraceae bacterium]|nr:hemolysin family protein [Solirubrobacteraceae bacterium]